jgi:hypothetical protein
MKSADRNLSVQLDTNAHQDEITADCVLLLGTLDMRILLPELIKDLSKSRTETAISICTHRARHK